MSVEQVAGYSPSFKKPAEILRLRRKRTRGAAGRLPSEELPPTSSAQKAENGGPGHQPQSKKCRRNPFANIANTCGLPAESPGPESGRPAEETALSKGVPQVLPAGDEDSILEAKFFSQEIPFPIQNKDSRILPECTLPENFPVDWSVKTWALFTSPHPFTWTDQLKASEEAKGLIQHCRSSIVDFPLHIEDPKSCTDLRCAFQQNLVYWLHPSLPWLSLFPRIGAERKMAGKSNPWAQDEELQQVLMSEWSLSFSSLYNLLRAKLCPYFYFCTYQFTVLFRAAGIAGSGVLTAVISPTTRGLREAMKDEGITFSLPLLDDRRNNKIKKSETTDLGLHIPDAETQEKILDVQEEHAGSSEDDDNDDGGISWLKEMGVQDKVRKPSSMSIKLRKEHTLVRMDHKPESAVMVKGPQTFTLLNFLMNNKSIVAGAGPQAGLPPTLLAPVAFRGASMQTLKARSINVRTQHLSGMKDSHCLEITGPIMPHALHSLTLMLKSAQKGNFTASFHSHEPTSVFNVALKLEHHEGKDHSLSEMSNYGLHPETLNQLMQQPTFGKSSMKHLEMKDYRYLWKL
ncbi:protein downstream neighbor of son homolog isoform X1 [Hypanus sabinus]|uniref:protein downstream neighbor of son homolog isoform X1 n=1 Tax=Hypanus sabinus TaxID=79690 RepID=UPI0028C4A28D|nr:protein downstream neighbor of son homolog isoform X1 [Hypanus sabinus]